MTMQMIILTTAMNDDDDYMTMPREKSLLLIQWQTNRNPLPVHLRTAKPYSQYLVHLTIVLFFLMSYSIWMLTFCDSNVICKRGNKIKVKSNQIKSMIMKTPISWSRYLEMCLILSFFFCRNHCIYKVTSKQTTSTQSKSKWKKKNQGTSPSIK